MSTEEERNTMMFEPETKPYQDKEWLEYQHITLGKNAVEIAEDCGHDDTTVRRWLRRFGLYEKYNNRRSTSEITAQ